MIPSIPKVSKCNRVRGRWGVVYMIEEKGDRRVIYPQLKTNSVMSDKCNNTWTLNKCRFPKLTSLI